MFAQNNFGDTASDGLAGPMGLLIIVLLAIATALLIRSMNKHLRRLPARFPHQDDPTGREVRSADPTGREVRSADLAGREVRSANLVTPSDETK